ncbi:MAG: DNA helicase RecQ [bacterium]|nr:DNA helicase RecQ [bacterium]
MIQQNNSSAYDTHSSLKRVFGFSSFKQNQESIIDAILGKSDVFAAMPTGGGKSLCYQLPALLLPGTTVVISPLIALMKDQVDSARSIGLRAAYLNSSLTSYEMSQVFTMLRDNEIDLLYVAPERFSMESFLATLKTVPVDLFAIDEAHCISEWGHDFRPDYLSLSKISDQFPGVSIAAFTATATRRVQKDIIEKLRLRTPYLVRASFNRPELFYQVTMKDGVERQVLSFVKKHPGEAGIVYRTTRQSVEDTAEYLINNGIRALPYHAGLDSGTRARNQEAFNRDDIEVIVATVAFGMGIDKSNIRFIVHGDLPKNMEGYYQETGRAGRDGEAAHCILFYGRGDIAKIRYFIDQVEDENERRTAVNNLSEMAGYASVNACRRRRILEYFDEKYEKENCGTCDICTGDVEQVDATTHAQIAMSAIMRVEQRFGATHVTDVITGANTEKIRTLRHNELKTYGAGKGFSKRYWRGILDELIGQECVQQTRDKFPTLNLTARGLEVLYGREKFFALKQKEQKQQDELVEEYNVELFELLRKQRRELARDRDIPPFVVFSDKTLREMSRLYPATGEAMLSINGVGERKFDEYGEIFLTEILEFLKENTHLTPMTEPNPAAVKKSKREKKPGTQEETWKLVQEGLSSQEIADRRGVSNGTIVQHMEKLILEGREIDITPHVDADKRALIESMFREFKTWRLKPIVEAAKESVSYDDARLVRATLEKNGFLPGEEKEVISN